ncbi:AraC family transcriptional regulator [Carnobacterium mobile]|uniref:AraC family transcriptional regulator n=1 Tax=Carnobacterium mobile TaxID=2750 RepID=UPI000552DC4D|nr:AraC family transcriptional regulator [Carnobacterium mobile]
MITFEHETIQPSEQVPVKLFSFEAISIDRIIPKHWHKSAELLYCIEGKLNVWIDTEFYCLNAGDFLFINSNIVHSTQSPTKNKVIVLQIPLSFFQEATKGGYNNYFTIRLNTLLTYEVNGKTNYFPKIKQLLLSMMKYNLHNNTPEKLKVISLLYELMYIMVGNFQNEKKQDSFIETQKYIERMTIITEYIKENYKDELPLATIAEKFNFSPPYFSRFFKKYMGITYFEYLNSVRMDEAYKMLMTTDEPIIDIALSVGFPNTKSFSKLFKQMYHSTPHQHRKKYKE